MLPPSADRDVSSLFHPLVWGWFSERFGQPTDPQRLGWPNIAANRHTLIAAPTGSGKTLAAFLVCLDRLVRRWHQGTLEDRLEVVYVSPLKALSNDIERNLRGPLGELRARAEAEGFGALPIRVAVRTGDTPARERQAMLRRAPHILVTTPESLYLLLTAPKSRELLRGVETVIVDEIHALARDKRGSHLALTLERLTQLCGRAPARIGLSATQHPIDQIAHFLVGSHDEPMEEPDSSPALESRCPTSEAAGGVKDLPEAECPRPDACQIVDAGHIRQLDLAIEVPESELSAVCSQEQWAEVYARLIGAIEAHRSTLIFVNTRRMAERIAHHLRERLGEDAVAAHHGSLSREIRLSVERRLKHGKLKAIVATASLEMGIDIGYINLVCQVGSPRSIATFLQRIGRSGHALGRVPKGRLFPLTRDELLEGMALVRAVRSGRLDKIEIPLAPLDILAQQIVAAVACEEWDERALYRMMRRAWPYRQLRWEDYQRIVGMLSEGIAPRVRHGAYLHRDRINGRLRARPGARLAAITSGGAIPETAEYRVVTEEDRVLVGSVDEDFAIESMAGDVFLLGNTSWRVRYVRGGEVVVRDAHGAPPSIPFWFGEAPGRTWELSEEISRLRSDLSERIAEANSSAALSVPDPAASPGADGSALGEWAWLAQECGVDAWGAQQAVRYVAAQHAAVGLVPTQKEIIFERFFDESGGMQLVIHAPLGARVNRAWGLALRKRFCRSFDFELQAAATDNGIVLSLSPQHSFPLEHMFRMLGPHNARGLLEQAVLAVPMFQVRWRWNVTRALAVLRMQAGKKVPPFLQRFRSDDLLAAVFPETVGCLENHHGDIQIPDHPLVAQTMDDCMHEAMDVDGWMELLRGIDQGRVKLIARDTREPSPFSHELLNANPYAFLDGAPLEERRTRAVSTRRSLDPEEFRDLTRLDPDAIAQVASQAWPLVRSADELHDALMSLGVLDDCESGDWRVWLEELAAAGRAVDFTPLGGAHDVPQTSSSTETAITESRAAGEPLNGAPPAEKPTRRFWTAAERWPVVRAAYPGASCRPLRIPAELDVTWERPAAVAELVRGRLQHVGPTTADALARFLELTPIDVTLALEALEGQGLVMRGRFGIPSSTSSAMPGMDGNTDSNQSADRIQWCDRRLLARIHRLTLDGLRRRIQPVEPEDYLRFLVRHHGLLERDGWGGPAAVREVIRRLEGFEMPAAAWEASVLPVRLGGYDPAWLDQLFFVGELMWGRLRCVRRDERRGAAAVAMHRAMPISLMLRENLAWLLPETSRPVPNGLRSNARDVLEALQTRGALFFQELAAATRLLPAHLEEALRELAALGLVTADGFSAVRAMAGRAVARAARRDGRRSVRAATAPAGRWSRFPGFVEPADAGTRREAWCRLLLARYGVLFRDLLVREGVAPPWQELVPVLRRMELRGEIRGGRFVAGVAGEQFALDAAVEALRRVRDEPRQEPWVVISAADPLNLIGIITAGPRIPALHANTLILQSGRCVAVKQQGRVTSWPDSERAVDPEMARALLSGRRASEPLAPLLAGRGGTRGASARNPLHPPTRQP